ncbi:MAG: Gfo/Idh/MocA family oxidoreductase [Candidatus Brocadiae bacterium]|nr:Gfo/Idh/MocA family oxidoreductase [Candidatus Brocadiia bacterium]
MSDKRISRRGFLGGSAASALTLTVVPRHVLGATKKSEAPSDKLNIASIGAGGKGSSDLRGVSSQNIVALCDVDDKKAADTFKHFGKARKYKDYRKMLDAMDKSIDAVTVSTPDHVHAPASMKAMKMGKHCFTQKPLCHNVFEAREMARTAKEMKVATVMGIQAHAHEGPRRVCEWVWNGMIGPVREVHYWTDRPIWPQGIRRPKGSKPVPKHLDWDLWLGPAANRPYNDAFAQWRSKKVGYLPFHWRAWWDFGCGALGDIGCHAMDAAFWALKLGSPTVIEPTKMSGRNPDTGPKWSTITYRFPARGDMPPVKVVWRDGVKKGQNSPPPRPKELEPEFRLPGNIGGQLIVGDKATILTNVYCGGPRIIPEAKRKAIGNPPQSIPRAPHNSHYEEWIRACKGGPKCGANFTDYAGPLTEMVLLGNLAVRTGMRIEWDAANSRCTNVPEANQFLRRDYRRGFEL